MRYLSFLLLASFLFYTSCQNDTGGKEKEGTEVSPEADSTATGSGQATVSEPPVQNMEDTLYAVKGKTWVLSKYTYEGNPERPVGEDPLFITIEGNRLSGNGGCNNLNGQATLTGDDKVDISVVARTKKLCGGLMIQESRFIQLLEEAEAYKVNMVFLELSGPNGQLTFRNNLK